MSADKKTRVRETITACQQKKIDAIIAEVDGMSLEKKTTDKKKLKQDLTESERKRVLLAEALHASREQLRKLQGVPGETDARALPFGVFVCYGRETHRGHTAIIRYHGRLYEANIEVPTITGAATSKGATLHDLRKRADEKTKQGRPFRQGEFLLLNNDLHIVEARGFDLVCGSLATVAQVLSNEKLMIKTVGDESILVTRAEPMLRTRILVGDHVEYDPDSLFVYSLLPKTRMDHLALEKVPDISYSDIGGLPDAIEQIRDAIEMPHLYPEYFQEHQLVPPKGILLYGPPGCGKTLIAKAVANSLARRIEEKTGEKGESFFLNVKGPELLNKYVGETEQAIRDLFARARNQATYRTPVVIFFDEMDSMFRVRGSGISSDMESTIVPQFLSELDGLQSLENVVIIGATNREDLIDPAVLRPGRLDRKIRIPRPDRQAAVEIFSKYLTPDLPIDSCHTETLGGSEAAVHWLIEEVVEELYSLSPQNEIMEITFASGGRKVLYSKDLNSGAIIENIVRRAKFQAVKDLVRTGRKGITRVHLITALHAEFKESEDLPSNSNPAEWYRIIGKGSERVVRIVPLQGKTPNTEIVETQTVNVPEKLK